MTESAVLCRLKVSRNSGSAQSSAVLLRTSSTFIDLTLELLQEGHNVRFQARGSSMYPTIRDGEFITVEPVEAATVRRGDIILYSSDRGPIAHRVVRLQGRDVILRGDRLSCCDLPIETRQVLGKVISVKRDCRRISLSGNYGILLRLHLLASRLQTAISRRLAVGHNSQ